MSNGHVVQVGVSGIGGGVGAIHRDVVVIGNRLEVAPQQFKFITRRDVPVGIAGQALAAIKLTQALGPMRQRINGAGISGDHGVGRRWAVGQGEARRWRRRIGVFVHDARVLAAVLRGDDDLPARGNDPTGIAAGADHAGDLNRQRHVSAADHGAVHEMLIGVGRAGGDLELLAEIEIPGVAGDGQRDHPGGDAVRTGGGTDGIPDRPGVVTAL